MITHRCSLSESIVGVKFTLIILSLLVLTTGNAAFAFQCAAGSNSLATYSCNCGNNSRVNVTTSTAGITSLDCQCLTGFTHQATGCTRTTPVAAGPLPLAKPPSPTNCEINQNTRQITWRWPSPTSDSSVAHQFSIFRTSRWEPLTPLAHLPSAQITYTDPTNVPGATYSIVAMAYSTSRNNPIPSSVLSERCLVTLPAPTILTTQQQQQQVLPAPTNCTVEIHRENELNGDRVVKISWRKGTGRNSENVHGYLINQGDPAWHSVLNNPNNPNEETAIFNMKKSNSNDYNSTTHQWKPHTYQIKSYGTSMLPSSPIPCTGPTYR